MTVTRRRVLAIAASWAGAALVPGAAVARSHWQGRALGADASLVLDGPEDRAQAVLSDLRGLLEHVETQFSLHDPRSALARLNRTGVLHDPHPDFSALLDLAGRLHAATGGRYDPTVQPVWAALAEGRDPAAARASVGWYRVLRTPDAIRLGRGAIALVFRNGGRGYPDIACKGASSVSRLVLIRSISINPIKTIVRTNLLICSYSFLFSMPCDNFRN